MLLKLQSESYLTCFILNKRAQHTVFCKESEWFLTHSDAFLPFKIVFYNFHPFLQNDEHWSKTHYNCQTNVIFKSF